MACKTESSMDVENRGINVNNKRALPLTVTEDEWSSFISTAQVYALLEYSRPTIVRFSTITSDE